MTAPRPGRAAPSAAPSASRDLASLGSSARPSPRARTGRAKPSIGQRAVACDLGFRSLAHGTRSPAYLELSHEERIGWRRAAQFLRQQRDDAFALIEHHFAPEV